MKLKTSELTGVFLDWAVHVALHGECEGYPEYEYSTDWAQGGPIIEREVISLDYALCYGETGQEWEAVSVDDLKLGGPTPLVAAMRCYVASKLGDEVDVPIECLIYETDEEQ